MTDFTSNLAAEVADEMERRQSERRQPTGDDWMNDIRTRAAARKEAKTNEFLRRLGMHDTDTNTKEESR